MFCFLKEMWEWVFFVFGNRAKDIGKRRRLEQVNIGET